MPMNHTSQGCDRKRIRALVATLIPALNSCKPRMTTGGAQYIYGTRRSCLSFKSFGVQAQGRTTILKLNYRHPAEVLQVAYAFARDVMSTEEADEARLMYVGMTRVMDHLVISAIRRRHLWRGCGSCMGCV